MDRLFCTSVAGREREHEDQTGRQYTQVREREVSLVTPVGLGTLSETIGHVSRGQETALPLPLLEYLLVP